MLVNLHVATLECCCCFGSSDSRVSLGVWWWGGNKLHTLMVNYMVYFLPSMWDVLALFTACVSLPQMLLSV